MDATSLFTNITHTEGIDCLRDQLNERTNPKVKTEFLIKLMEIILYNNVFEFHETFWKQLVGAAMGSKPILPYANIFMAKIDKLIRSLDIAKAIALFKRFLDDLFLLYAGSTKGLRSLFEKINQMHPTIKFTMSDTTLEHENKDDKCDCEPLQSIPFLDTLCTIKNGRIETDLYKKKTDRNQYLLPTSCHPAQTNTAIPISLSMIIVRICSDPNLRDLRLNELMAQLLDRGYSKLKVQAAIDRARSIPRVKALRKVIKKQIKRAQLLSTHMTLDFHP